MALRRILVTLVLRNGPKQWDDGTKTMRGQLIDQAALRGLLAKVRDIDAPLTSLLATSDSAGDGHVTKLTTWIREMAA